MRATAKKLLWILSLVCGLAFSPLSLDGCQCSFCRSAESRADLHAPLLFVFPAPAAYRHDIPMETTENVSTDFFKVNFA